MRGRNNQTSRIIKIISWIESSLIGLSVREIHERLTESGSRVSIRTIYRDLDAINLAGMPIIEEPNLEVPKESKWRIEKGRGLRSRAGYTDREVLALYFSFQGVLPLINDSVREQLRTALALIEQSMGSAEWVYYRSLSSIIRVGENPFPRQGIKWQNLETLIGAAIDGKSISFRLQQEDSQGWVKVVPGTISFENGNVTLRGVDGYQKGYELADIEKVRAI